MKVIVLMLLISAIGELLWQVSEWIKEAKELINSDDCIDIDECDIDIEAMLSNNTAFGGTR